MKPEQPTEILTEPADIDWLFSTHIDRDTRHFIGSPKLYGCAVLWGNSDAPTRITLYHSDSPTIHDDCVTIYREDTADDSDNWEIAYRWRREEVICTDTLPDGSTEDRIIGIEYVSQF